MKKILIVDDSAFVRMEMIQGAEGSDFKMVEAGNAAEALECLRAINYFSMAIIDYNMPDMNGIELTRAIREIYPQLPVIILSSYGGDRLKQDAKVVGVTCWALKPISGPALHKLVNRLVKN